MIDALGDPYSSYLTSAEYRDTLQGISGEFEGIGAGVASGAQQGPGVCDARSRVRARHRHAARGVAAQRAGLRTGVEYMAADGISFDGLTVDGARERIPAARRARS